jgi:3-oxoacyl-[acyl-carrier protein] reductase
MGLATVERLARDGFSVLMIDRDAKAADQQSQRLQAKGLAVQARVLDLTDEQAIRALVNEWEPVQVLVNNAGVFDERSFDAVSADDFRRVYEINLIAAANLSQAVTRRMPEGGRIINIASRAYLGARNHPHYVASKAALVGYTRASAMELAARGIWVNAIAPGLIDTPLLRALTPERMAAQLALQPTGRAGRPEEVAQAVSFFASPATGFITGQVLFVDGGKSLGGSGA